MVPCLARAFDPGITNPEPWRMCIHPPPLVRLLCATPEPGLQTDPCQYIQRLQPHTFPKVVHCEVAAHQRLFPFTRVRRSPCMASYPSPAIQIPTGHRGCNPKTQSCGHSHKIFVKKTIQRFREDRFPVTCVPGRSHSMQPAGAKESLHKFPARTLPGRAKFLPTEFLRNRARKPRK